MEITIQHIGIIGSILLTFLGFCFGILKFWKPIYYSYSRKYDKSAFGDKEDIIELIVRNYGLTSDTDIELTIASSITFELLNVQSGVSKLENTVYISRLPSRSKVNILISSSSEHFTKESISSAKSASKVIAFMEEPKETLSYFLMIIEYVVALIITIIVGYWGFIIGKDVGNSATNYPIEENIVENPEYTYAIKVLKSKGWSGIEDFYSQPKLTQAYPLPLFPVEISSVEKKGNKYHFTFNIINKLDTFLSTSINAETVFNTANNVQNSKFERTNVTANSSKKLEVILPASKADDETKYLFDISLQPRNHMIFMNFYLTIDVNDYR